MFLFKFKTCERVIDPLLELQIEEEILSVSKSTTLSQSILPHPASTLDYTLKRKGIRVPLFECRSDEDLVDKSTLSSNGNWRV